MSTTGNSQGNSSQQYNPYAAPSGALVIDTTVFSKEDGLRSSPAVLPWGAGSNWFGNGWELFKRAPAKLLGITLIYLGALLCFGLIPGFGDIASTLLSGIWVAGWMVIFAKLAANESLPVATLFDGFVVPSRLRLLMLGLVYLAGLIAVIVVCTVLFVSFSGFNPFAEDALTQFSEVFFANVLLFFAVLALSLVGMFVLYAFIAYAPPLMVFHNVRLWDACAMSARGFLANWRALTVFGLLFLFWALVSMITLFIGMLVLLPVITGAFYVSYRQIFVEGGAEGEGASASVVQ